MIPYNNIIITVMAIVSDFVQYVLESLTQLRRRIYVSGALTQRLISFRCVVLLLCRCYNIYSGHAGLCRLSYVRCGHKKVSKYESYDSFFAIWLQATFVGWLAWLAAEPYKLLSFLYLVVWLCRWSIIVTFTDLVQSMQNIQKTHAQFKLKHETRCAGGSIILMPLNIILNVVLILIQR